MRMSDSQQEWFCLQILLHCTTHFTNPVIDFLCCSLITKLTLTVRNRRTIWTKLSVLFLSCFKTYISASDKKNRRIKIVALESKKLQCISTFMGQAIVSPCAENCKSFICEIKLDLKCLIVCVNEKVTLS